MAKQQNPDVVGVLSLFAQRDSPPPLPVGAFTPRLILAARACRCAGPDTIQPRREGALPSMTARSLPIKLHGPKRAADSATPPWRCWLLRFFETLKFIAAGH